MTDRTVVEPASQPRLPSGVRLKFDKVRDQWVIMAPERMFVLDPIALEIVKRCDGEVSVAGIIDQLAEVYKAPRDQIGKDVIQMLQDFADKGVIVA